MRARDHAPRLFRTDYQPAALLEKSPLPARLGVGAHLALQVVSAQHAAHDTQLW
jgi:hypothetical protein